MTTKKALKKLGIWKQFKEAAIGCDMKNYDSTYTDAKSFIKRMMKGNRSIRQCFIFSESLEGHDYWIAIDRRIKEMKEINETS